jgi:hypothetical protein
LISISFSPPSRPAEDAGEGEVGTFERAQRPGPQRDGAAAQRLDQHVGGLVALAPLAQAAVDDLLQLVAAAEQADPEVRMRSLASPFTSIWPTC